MIKVYVTHKNNKPVDKFFFPVMSVTRGRQLAMENGFGGYMTIDGKKFEI